MLNRTSIHLGAALLVLAPAAAAANLEASRFRIVKPLGLAGELSVLNQDSNLSTFQLVRSDNTVIRETQRGYPLPLGLQDQKMDVICYFKPNPSPNRAELQIALTTGPSALQTFHFKYQKPNWVPAAGILDVNFNYKITYKNSEFVIQKLF